MIRSVCVLSVSALVFLSSILHAQGQLSRISGTVKDEQGRSIADAEVVAENPDNMPSVLKKTTDEKGRFAIGGLKVGQWKLTVRAEGFLPLEQIVDLGLGQNLKMEITLKKATGTSLLATSSEAQEEIQRAAAYFDSGDYDKALKVYEDLLGKAPDVHQIHFNMGLCYERKGDDAKAAEQFLRFVEKEPDNFQGNLNLANALSRAGKKEESIPYYEKCTRLQPQDAVAFFNLGLAQFEADELTQAADSFQKSLELDPGLADSYFMLGNIQLRSGDPDAARKSYERFLELAPDSPQAGAARQALEQLKQS
jgi:tetratricopeptide (TPR) repeat protein